MHRLQNLDDLPRTAPIEIVDVEDDLVDGTGRRRAALLRRAPICHQRGEALEILADRGDEPEVA